MDMSLKHFSRYKEIATLLWKYGRSDLVRRMAMGDESIAKEVSGSGDAVETPPEQLADDLEAMGPTFIKLGQVLSSRPDLLPPSYVKALARLQDKVKPFPYAEVEQIVESELGVRISKAFSRFDTQPLAGASLGQVHAAALRDGREVVVKVQRPNVALQVAEDFEVLAQIAGLLDQHTDFGKRHRLRETLNEMRIAIVHELNYEREREHLVAMGRNLEEFELVQVPQPVTDYCTKRVLTMEYVRGRKITKLSPLARLELDGAKLSEELFRAYLKQVLVDGLFHADPHPGNVFITEDHRIALLDLGMVGRTTPAMRNSLLKVLIAVSDGKPEEVADVICGMSEKSREFERNVFEKQIAQLILERQGETLSRSSMGRTLLQVSRSAAEVGLWVPSELTMLGKTLFQLDEVGRILDPEFDPDAAIRRNAAEIMSRRLHKDASTGSFFATMLDLKEFVVELPLRLNKILNAISSNELEWKVRAVDAPIIMEGLLKIANRITTGLILAALIVSASLLTRVETAWTLFGYPGLAILCFLGAAAGGVYLLVSIFIQDKRSEHRARHPGPH